jgi:hypothetical protein
VRPSTRETARADGSAVLALVEAPATVTKAVSDAGESVSGIFLSSEAALLFKAL